MISPFRERPVVAHCVISIEYNSELLNYMYTKWEALGRRKYKVGCVFPMVVVSIPPHAGFGRNDHRKDAPLCIYDLDFSI